MLRQNQGQYNKRELADNKGNQVFGEHGAEKIFTFNLAFYLHRPRLLRIVKHLIGSADKRRMEIQLRVRDRFHETQGAWNECRALKELIEIRRRGLWSKYQIKLSAFAFENMTRIPQVHVLARHLAMPCRQRKA